MKELVLRGTVYPAASVGDRFRINYVLPRSLGALRELENEQFKIQMWVEQYRNFENKVCIIDQINIKITEVPFVEKKNEKPII